MSIVGSLHSALRHQYELPATPAQKPTSEAKVIYSSNSFADKVTISFEAQKIAESLEKEIVEQYVPPTSELSPAFSNSSARPDVLMEEARKYMLLHENLAADGDISMRDIEALQGYVDIMISTNIQGKK
jgi:hypothetical protein